MRGLAELKWAGRIPVAHFTFNTLACGLFNNLGLSVRLFFYKPVKRL